MVVQARGDSWPFVFPETSDGALAAALAIFEWGRQELGAERRLRAPFYLLILPSSFFLDVDV
jgi:hypothetical protein